MSDLNPAIAPDVQAACLANAAEVAAALQAAFGEPFHVEPSESITLDPAHPPPDLATRGLVCVFSVGSAAALLLWPESSGLLPTWYSQPDADGVRKLETLARDLGTLLLPEPFVTESANASPVANLAMTLARAGVPSSAGAVPISIATETHRGTVWLVWPGTRPVDEILRPSGSDNANEAGQPTPGGPGVADASNKNSRRAAELREKRSGPPREMDEGLRLLPPYARSLLKIRVPVVVTLAETKHPIGRVLELVPGTIITFDKTCEEMLALEVGRRTVATGEAVKIGDKFGLRVTSIELPDERFTPVRGPSGATSSAMR